MKNWYGAVSVFAGTFWVLAMPAAHAAEMDAEAGAGTYQLEEIIVTATKVGEVSAQTLPLSITVLDATRINDANLHTIEDVQRQTPGLNLTRNGQWTRLYMRGIGTNLDFIGSDPSVTVHVDGVYQARTATVLDEFLDVERVEVLRGPQGTLYGRNSTGGTINIITRLPDADPRASVSAEVGSDNLHRVSASASSGLGSDNLIGRIAVLQTEHDPYVDNRHPTGVDGLLDDNTVKANASLQTFFGDSGTIILRGDYYDADHVPGAFKSTGQNAVGQPVALTPLLNIPDDPFAVNSDLANPRLDIDSWGSSLELQVDLAAGWRMTSLTGYREMNNAGQEDTDGSNLTVLVTAVDEAQDQVSEELRFNYESERLKWVTGLYYLNEQHDSDLQVNISGGALQRRYVTRNETTVMALFTEATYSLTSALNLTAGVRYSDEEKQFENQYLPNVPGHPALGPAFAVDETHDWQDWSPRVAVDYSVTEDALLYASASKGFKSGGFNVTANDVGFDPEKVLAYELGSKLTWADGAVRSNIALFHYDYTDLQVSAFSLPGVLSISNAADATVRGIELENQWLVNDHWMLMFNYAVLDATYDDYVAPLQVTAVQIDMVDVSGNKLNASPGNKFNLASQHYWPSAWGEWRFRVDYTWQDEQYFTAFNQSVSSQGAYGLFNALLALAAEDESWEVQIYGENLGDVDYSTASREFAATTTGVTRDINPPLTVGTRLTLRFD